VLALPNFVACGAVQREVDGGDTRGERVADQVRCL